MIRLLVVIVTLCVSSLAFGQSPKQAPQTRFWNLTPFTLSEFNLAPAGTTNWGANQCKNDRDGTVSPNERLRITDTAPGVRGNSATGRTKPATLSTGAIVQVPEHMEPGTAVRVDTRTGEYLGRAN